MLLITPLIFSAIALVPQECCKTTTTPVSMAIEETTPTRPDLVDTAVSAGGFETLVSAVKAADLVELLKSEGPFTVFAPADSAFAKIPADRLNALIADKAALTDVLTYHVVPGRLMAADVLGSQWLETAEGQSLWVHQVDGAPMIDGARIVKTDIVCGNGVIHVIDAVVQPRKDIVDTAVANGSFQTLVAAVKAAGLVDTLRGRGPFTVFAPTDEAFKAIPEAALQALLKDQAKLSQILTYHVVPGRILSTDLTTSKRPTAVDTAQGSAIKVQRSESGDVSVNGSNVVLADIIVGNGVIHVIDAVLLPKSGDN